MRRTADLECILGAQRLRQIFKCLGFAFLFVWILFGNYGPRVEENRVRTRKLLSLQLPQNFSGNDDIEVRRERERDKEKRERKRQRERERKRERESVSTYIIIFIQCSEIHDYDEEFYCDFVKKVDSCGGDEGFIAYFEFVYCLVPYKLLPLSMIILV